MKTPVRVVVSGAAGQISYSAIFKIFTGEVYGFDQPVHLVMLEVPQALKACEGVEMEVIDCAFPCYAGITITSDAEVAFKDADYAILFGAFPRGPGMERKDLLEKNKNIFEAQGKAILSVAKPELKVLVVGNPANTNACILAHFATNLLPGHINAMTRLDHNRTVGQVAIKAGCAPAEVDGVFVLGNHSGTMVPIFCNTTVAGKKFEFDDEWLKSTMAVIRKRGGAVIAARGKSSAASAAVAALDHMHDWAQGTNGKYVSVSLMSQKGNFYNVPEGLIFSVPCVSENGEWKIVDVKYCEKMQPEVDNTIKDLLEERQLALGF